MAIWSESMETDNGFSANAAGVYPIIKINMHTPKNIFFMV